MKVLTKLWHILRQYLNFCFFLIILLCISKKQTFCFEAIPQCLLFPSFFYIQARSKRDIRRIYFLIAFVCLYSFTDLSSPRCTFIKLKACNQFFTLDFLYICNELVSFNFSLLCKFWAISKFRRINNKSFLCILHYRWHLFESKTCL